MSDETFTPARAEEIANRYVEWWRNDWGLVVAKVSAELNMTRMEAMVYINLLCTNGMWAGITEHGRKTAPLVDSYLKELKEDDDWKPDSGAST